MLLENINDSTLREQMGEQIANELGHLSERERELIVVGLCKDLTIIVEENMVDIYTEIWILSFLCQISKRKEYLLNLVECVKNSEGLSWQNKYYMYWQIKTLLFTIPELVCEETLVAEWQLLYETDRIFKEDFRLPKCGINRGELDENFVIVIIEQFLQVEHGPTKTVLDRCEILEKKLGKKVMLINTAECLASTGEIPVFKEFRANYIEEYKNVNSVNWKDSNFSFYQCEKTMPSFDEIRLLLNLVLERKPGSVILIGGPSLLASVINKYVPVFAVGLTQSGVISTVVDYQTVEEKSVRKSLELISSVGREAESLIPGKFTFALKEQTEMHSREDYDLSNEEFVIAVIGGRLAGEITEDFLDMFDNILFDNMKLIIIGCYQKEAWVKEKYPKLFEHMIFTGYCEDVLSMLDLCDIYVNPHRRGGATSAVEAMYKGLPVVTTRYGDVEGVVDGNFSYESYAEMGKAILKLHNDKDFYKEQSKHAIELAAFNMDSASEFIKMFNEYKERQMANKEG